MAVFSKRSGTHKETSNVQAKVNGEWKQGLELLMKRNGVWAKIWRNILTITAYATSKIEKTFSKVTPTVKLINVQLTIFYKNGKITTNPLISSITVNGNSATNIFSSYENGIPIISATAKTISAENKILFDINIRAGSEYSGITVNIERVELVE